MKKTSPAKRILAGLLALVMSLSLALVLAPESAQASSSASYYNRIMSMDELTDGEYVIAIHVGNALYAMDKYDSASSGWVTVDSIASDSGNIPTTLTDPTFVWTITVSNGTAKLTDRNGKTIAPKGANTNGITSGSFFWGITCSSGTFEFSDSGSYKVTLACNKETGKFRAYKNTTVSGNPNGYPCQFILYKKADAPAASTQVVYEKVTSRLQGEDLSGSYLLVYEAGQTGYVFNAALAAMDTPNNYFEAQIGNNCIEADPKYAVTLEIVSKNGKDYYAIKTYGGQYIYFNPNNPGNGSDHLENTISYGTEGAAKGSAYLHTVTVNSDGSVSLYSNSGYMQFNNGSGVGEMRFRYYQSGGQQAVTLYREKVQAPTAEPGDGSVVLPGDTVYLNCETEGADIVWRYTSNTIWRPYAAEEGIAIPDNGTADCTVFAFAMKDGMADSDWLAAHYTVLQPPTSSLASGRLATPGQKITLSCVTDNVTYEISTDGGATWEALEGDTFRIPRNIVGDYTVQVRSALSGVKSEVVELTYQIIIPSIPSYAITVAGAENGTVTASADRAVLGAVITVTTAPDEGYVLAGLTVTAADGSELVLTDKGSGAYTFTMPSGDVTVTAVFASDKCDGLPPHCPSTAFTDLDTTKWYHEATDYVLNHKIMNGYGGGIFAPSDTVDRATMVQILYNLEGRPAVSGDVPFTDVAEGAWYHDAVLWAASHGIVEGSGSAFWPKGVLARQEMVVILYRYADYKGYDTTARGDLSQFTDGDTAAAWANDALSWAVGAGILSGRGNDMLSPDGSSMRSEVAKFFMNFCEAYMK